LAHGGEVVIECGAIARTEGLAQVAGLARHQVEDAAALARQADALIRRVTGTEQRLEQLARVVLHRQRRRRITEGDRLAVAAAVVAVTGALAAALFGGHLERRNGRVLANVLGGDLVDGDAAVRVVADARW